ncbi:hypothetical protein [Salinigranum rubrum]|nr:hypothetical protein [Salinigranum rubrum]
MVRNGGGMFVVGMAAATVAFVVGTLLKGLCERSGQAIGRC